MDLHCQNKELRLRTLHSEKKNKGWGSSACAQRQWDTSRLSPWTWCSQPEDEPCSSIFPCQGGKMQICRRADTKPIWKPTPASSQQEKKNAPLALIFKYISYSLKGRINGKRNLSNGLTFNCLEVGFILTLPGQSMAFCWVAVCSCMASQQLCLLPCPRQPPGQSGTQSIFLVGSGLPRGICEKFQKVYVHSCLKIEQNTEFQNFHRSVTLGRKYCLKKIKTFHFDKSPNTPIYFICWRNSSCSFPKKTPNAPISTRYCELISFCLSEIALNGDIPTKSHNLEETAFFFPHWEYSDWLYVAVWFCILPAEPKALVWKDTCLSQEWQENRNKR